MNIFKQFWAWLHKMASPKHFYRISSSFITWFLWLTIILTLVGLYYSLVKAPMDYQQGDSYRIMFIHVPAAWMSMFVYVVMAVLGLISLVWRIKLADVMIASSAPIGAAFTFIALVTGSLWGKPMWGAWWVWDARLTTELILFFLYLGVISLNSAIEDKRIAARAVAVLSLVGVINIPIIHYSVQWWNTLHQASSINILKGQSSIHIDMLIPLIIMSFAFKFYYGMVVLKRARCEVLERERNSRWVQEIIMSKETLTSSRS